MIKRAGFDIVPCVLPLIKFTVIKTLENSGIRLTIVEQYQILRALSFFAKLEKRRTRTRIGTKRYTLIVSGQKASPANLIIKRRGNL